MIEIPSYPNAQGVSAPFSGFIGGDLIIGGGCNFPTTPAAEGGKKVYYADAFRLDTDSQVYQWEPIASLPFPNAYGASIETAEGLICIGGMNEDTSLKTVYCLQKDSGPKKFIIRMLPSLPESMDNAAATCIGRQLYVTGGNQGNGGNSLYTLNLDKDTTWTKLTDYPGPKRIQPVLLASNNELYLFGGFDVLTPATSTVGTKEGIISSNFIVYNLKDRTWGQPQSIPAMSDGSPRALVGSAGTRIGNQFFIAGGVNYTIFKSAIEGKAPKDYMKCPAAWYQFSKDLLVYDLSTQAWTVIPSVDGFNKAGGNLLHHNGTLYMVCGEVKPGIRTNEIIQKELKGLLSATHPARNTEN